MLISFRAALYSSPTDEIYVIGHISNSLTTFSSLFSFSFLLSLFLSPSLFLFVALNWLLYLIIRIKRRKSPAYYLHRSRKWSFNFGDNYLSYERVTMINSVSISAMYSNLYDLSAIYKKKE